MGRLLGPVRRDTGFSDVPGALATTSAPLIDTAASPMESLRACLNHSARFSSGAIKSLGCGKSVSRHRIAQDGFGAAECLSSRVNIRELPRGLRCPARELRRDGLG
jgi:hypothetical protein